MTSVAEQLAIALQGRAHELPGDAPPSSWVIELPDGRMPVLIRDFGHALGVCIDGVRAWMLRPGAFDEVVGDEVVAGVRTWTSGHAKRPVSLYELALRVPASLSDALAQRWTVSLPGVAEPREAWLHGPEFDAAAVGLFPGRVLVSRDTTQRSWSITTRDQLATHTPEIIAAVREQLDAYAINVALAERVRACADALAAELSRRLALACTAESWSRPSHWRTCEVRIVVNRRELARVSADGNELLVHAGVVGKAGWRGRAASFEQLDLDAITAAIEQAERTLTFETMQPGDRYRVLAKLGELRPGMLVTFVMFDDIDNHYGICRFRSDDGRELSVPGDYSTPRNSPLGAAYRYLERVKESP